MTETDRPQPGTRLRLGAAALAAMLCLTAGCKVDLNDELEELMGSMSSKSLESEYVVDDDPLMNGYLTRMGQSLAAVSDRPNLPYSFKVLDTDQVNALAAPYGHIYVFKGLLDLVETEDELAAVLGHEVTHVVAKHSLKSFKESLLFGLVLGSFKNRKYDDAKTVLAVGNLFRELRHSRKNEHEADYRGAHYTVLAKYDPAGAPGFFGKLLQKYGGRRPSRLETIFSTHPVTTDRISRMENLDWIQPDNQRYVDTMLTVGRGFADRYQFRAAEQHFAKALTAAPGNADAQLGLALALAGQGELTKSREQYRLAAGSAPDQAGVRETRQKIDYWAQADADSSPASTKTRAALRAMVPRMKQVANDAATTQARIGKPSTRNVDSATDATKALVGGQALINEVVQALPEGADAQRDPILSTLGQSNALTQLAISQVEATASRGLATTETVRRTATLLANAAQSPPDETSAKALLRAAQRLAAEAPETLSLVRASVRTAEEALASIDRASRAGESAAQSLWRTREQSAEEFRGRSAADVRSAANRALGAAKEANRRSARAREQTIRSRFRSVAGEADSVAASANAVQRLALDGMLAHYLMVEPQTVTRLREDYSLAAADRIMTLGEAQQSKRSTAANQSWKALQWTNMVDQYQPPRLDNLAILTKLFVNAAKTELDLAPQKFDSSG